VRRLGHSPGEPAEALGISRHLAFPSCSGRGSSRRPTAFSRSVLHSEVLAPPDIEARFGLLGGNIFQGEMSPD
jgi:hypothetical protein